MTQYIIFVSEKAQFDINQVDQYSAESPIRSEGLLCIIWQVNRMFSLNFEFRATILATGLAIFKQSIADIAGTFRSRYRIKPGVTFLEDKHGFNFYQFYGNRPVSAHWSLREPLVLN